MPPGMNRSLMYKSGDFFASIRRVSKTVKSVCLAQNVSILMFDYEETSLALRTGSRSLRSLNSSVSRFTIICHPRWEPVRTLRPS